MKGTFEHDSSEIQIQRVTLANQETIIIEENIKHKIDLSTKKHCVTLYNKKVQRQILL